VRERSWRPLQAQLRKLREQPSMSRGEREGEEEGRRG